MSGFLSELPKLYQLWKKDQKEQAEKQALLANGPTEAFIKELMRQSEQGVEVTLAFPGGVHMTITRKAQSIETLSNGIRLREEYLDAR